MGKRVLPAFLEPVIAMDVLGDLSLQPGLAESWKRISDKVLEVRLRQGVRFHNGDEMTSEDVAFSFGPEAMFGDTQPHRGEGAETIRTDSASASLLRHAMSTRSGCRGSSAVALVGEG